MDLKLLIMFIFYFNLIAGKLSQKSAVIEDVNDQKELKKLLKTKNNVLIMYLNNPRDAQQTVKVFKEVANVIKGEGTLVMIDCSTNTEIKKMCKKLKIPTETTASSFYIKHYKDGAFHKDYDRQLIVSSMINFMRDPTGDLPWDEDPIGSEVLHIKNMDNLKSILDKQSRPMMIMFYAPWCGYCKQLKPDYSAAATELKTNYLIAAMDVNRPENVGVRKKYNITGFPTLLYFNGGKMKYAYEGENNKAAIMAFMENPTEPLIKINKDDWALDVDTQIVHLTGTNFMPSIQDEKSAMVMFYAPWCGHCKRMKPEYEKAALHMKNNNIHGVLAAVDATKETVIAGQFNVKGYPSIKFFVKGEFKFDVNVRESDKIIEFMKDPSEPPPPPPPEKAWEEEESEVVHLNDDNFSTFLKRKKHVLVMFYAPWCGHCKKAKPEFVKTAEHFKDDFKTKVAAVDCTQHRTLCSAYDVKGYPTIKYFNHYKIKRDYNGGRTASDFIKYLTDPDAPEEKPVAEPFGTYPGSENIITLTDDNFDTKMKSIKKSLVMFYAPWCGHCTQMKPAYGEVATRLLNRPNSDTEHIAVAAVDSTVQHTLTERFSIKSFPTIKYFENGIFKKDYDGGRTSDALYNYLIDDGNVKDEF